MVDVCDIKDPEVNPDQLVGQVIVFDAAEFANWVSEHEEWGLRFLKEDGSVVSMHYGTERFLICGAITFQGAPALPPRQTAQEKEVERYKRQCRITDQIRKDITDRRSVK